jgi:Condensation domain
MPFTGPLFKFALFRTWDDEFYLFACGHHIVIDGFGIALVGGRLATVYSAIISDAPVPPAFFGSLQDLIRCESEYEASSVRTFGARWTAEGSEMVLDFPVNRRVRPESKRFPGVKRLMPPQLAAVVAEGSTVMSAFVAAWARLSPAPHTLTGIATVKPGRSNGVAVPPMPA